MTDATGRAIGVALNIFHGNAGAAGSHVDADTLPRRARSLWQLGHPPGLWLPEAFDMEAAAELYAGLGVRSINGFPQGMFQGVRVGHAVYRPGWDSIKRAEHTRRLITLAARVGSRHVSISTVPLGWRGTDRSGSADALLDMVEVLAEATRRSGVCVTLDLEPEPGCALASVEDAVCFFKDHIWAKRDDAQVRRHLGLCHDVCHATVDRPDLADPQTPALNAAAAAGLNVHKVQLTAAPVVDADTDRVGFAALARLAEPRFLHQTCVQSGGRLHRYDNLPDALTHHRPIGRWATHYHLPLGRNPFDISRQDAELRSVLHHPATADAVLELETYTHPIREAADAAVLSATLHEAEHVVGLL